MASTTLVRHALERVSDQLQDLDPQFERWTQASLVHALNDGQRVLGKYLPNSCARVDAIKLVPGTKQSIELVSAARLLPGDGSTPVDTHGNRLIGAGFRNMGANGTTPGRAIRPVERVVLDQADPLWHTKTGRPVTQITYDPQTPKVFYVSPGVPASGGDVWIEIPWLPDPNPIPLDGDYSASGSDATLLSVDDRYVDDVVNYVIARAYMKDADVGASMQLAGSFSQMFVSSINTQAVAAGLPDPKLRVLPIPGGK